jgi:hypothetical protein
MTAHRRQDCIDATTLRRALSIHYVRDHLAMGTHSGLSLPCDRAAGTAPKESRAYECRGSFHTVWNRFWLDGGLLCFSPGSRMELTKANRYRETAFDPKATSDADRHSA